VRRKAKAAIDISVSVARGPAKSSKGKDKAKYKDKAKVRAKAKASRVSEKARHNPQLLRRASSSVKISIMTASAQPGPFCFKVAQVLTSALLWSAS
jgi:hypothetical protein